MKKQSRFRSFLCLLSLFALFPVLLVFSPSVFARDTWTTDCGSNVTATYYFADSTLEISGTGAMDNYYNWPVYPDVRSARKIIISEGVTRIGGEAFKGFDDIEEISFPKSLTTIGFRAFQKSDFFTDLVIPDGVTTIEMSAFSGCQSLVSLKLPDSVRTVAKYAFYNCRSLSSLDLGNGVEELGELAFYYCHYDYVILPKSLKKMDRLAVSFVDRVCYAGTEEEWMQVDYNHNYYDAPCAFEPLISGNNICNQNMTVVYGLASRHGTTVAHIPASVQTIAEDAFRYADDLRDVYYDGTKAEWKRISIGDGNDDLLSAEIHTEHKHGISTETSCLHATCTEDGLREGLCVCGTPTSEVLEKTGHAWTVNWEFSEDASSATAAFSCQNRPSHNMTQTVKTVKGTTVPATCEEEGSVVWEAELDFEDTSYQSQTVRTIPRLGHSYGAPEWNWQADGSEASAIFVCANDKSHTVTLTDTAPTRETLQEADYEHDGNAVLTAEIEFEGQTFKNKFALVVPQLQRVYFDPVWQWSEDKKTACVTFQNKTGYKPLTLWVYSGETRIEPGCTADGHIDYTASVEVEGKIYSDTQSFPLPSQGHVWGPWHVSDGKSTRVCALVPQHVEQRALSGTILNGDITGDGFVRSDDARLALRRSVGLESFRKGSNEFMAADVNSGGNVMADDARLILRASVGLEVLPEKTGGEAPDAHPFDNREALVYFIRQKGRVQPSGITVYRTAENYRFEYDPKTDDVRYLYSYLTTAYTLTPSRDGETLIIEGGDGKNYRSSVTVGNDETPREEDIAVTFLTIPENSYAQKLWKASAISKTTEILDSYLNVVRNFDTWNYSQDQKPLTGREKLIAYTKKQGTREGFTRVCRLNENARLVYDATDCTLRYIYSKDGSTPFEAAVTLGDSGSSGSLICLSGGNTVFTCDVSFIDGKASFSNIRDASYDFNTRMRNETIRTDLNLYLARPLSSATQSIAKDPTIAQALTIF